MSNYLKKTKRASEELGYDATHGVIPVTNYSKSWADYVLSDDYFLQWQKC